MRVGRFNENRQVARAIGWISLVLFFGVGCTARHSYEVKGRVVGFGDDGRTIIVQHQDVPDLMPAMTMPFRAADSSRVDGLDSGDEVSFTLTIFRDSSWITNVTKLPPGTLPLAEADTARGHLPGSDVPILEPGDTVPAVALTDQNGAPVRLSDYRGKALLITFIYTRCPLPDACPLLSRKFQMLQPELEKRFGDRAELLSVTFDPEHDTPAVLRDYAERYTNDLSTWRFATGERAEVDRLTDAFGVSTAPEAGQITHSLTTALIGPEGRVQYIWRGSKWSTDEVLERVESSLRE